jgi:hypothetical protein
VPAIHARAVARKGTDGKLTGSRTGAGTYGATRTPEAANACASTKAGLAARDPKDPGFAKLETRAADPKLPASCPDPGDEGGVRIRLCDSGAGRAQSLKSIRPRQWRRILATNGKDA